MNQQQFEAFMADQVAAIEASGIAPDLWIARHSTTFRAAWEDAMRCERHSPASVLALHPDLVLRAGIAVSLRQHGSFEAFEEGRHHITGEGAQIDVVVADYRQAMRLAGASRGTARPFAKARILVLTSDDRGSYIRRALEAGVHGYLLLGGALSEFIEAATTLAGGQHYLGRSVAQRMAESSTRTPLTLRETEVLQFVVSGESNQRSRDGSASRSAT
jgi:two-component system NarL family response regulator